MSRVYRIMAVDTPLMRACFSQAWDDAQLDNKPLLDVLKYERRCAMRAIQDGQTLKSQSANGHSAVFTDPGEGAAAPQEFVTMWENLISREGYPVGIGFLPAQRYLNFCLKYGLNPYCQDSWPAGCPEQWTPVNPPPPPATDQAIFDFVMCNLVAITESSSDYFWLRIKAGLQLV